MALFRTKDTCERVEKECVCKELKYNINSKILGITLDEQLNFLELSGTCKQDRKESKQCFEHSQGSEMDFQNLIKESN